MRVFFVLLLLDLFFASGSFAQAIHQTLIVRVAPPTQTPSEGAVEKSEEKPKDELKFPENFQVVDQEGFLRVLKKNSTVTSLDIEELKKVPRVQFVEKDDRFEAQNSEPHPKVEVSSIFTFAGCPVTETCSEPPREKLWAQESLDAELMNEEFKKLEFDPLTVQVAVIDTGFDTLGNTALMASPSLQVKKGFIYSGDPLKDENGHGTAIASLIGAKNGIGIAPQFGMTVYRVTPPGDQSWTTRSALKIAILRACNDGHDVINVSWAGQNPISTDDFFFKDLNRRGCIVVNAETQKVPSTFQIEDMPFNASTVFTLTNREKLKTTSKKLSCDQKLGVFQNTQSFQVALASGIIAHLIPALSQSESFNILEPEMKIQLLKNIMISSKFNKRVNGLKALAVASRWQHIENTPMSVKLTQLLSSHPHPVCEDEVADCLTTESCPSLKSCFKRTKRQAILCHKLENKTVPILQAIAIKTGSVETSALWLTQDKPVELEQTLEKYRSRDGQRHSFFDLSATLLETYFDAATDLPEKKVQFLKEWLESRELERVFSETHFLQTRNGIEKTVSTLVSFQQTVGFEKTFEVLDHWINKDSKSLLSFSKALAVTRLLSALIKNPTFESKKSRLIAMEGALYRRLHQSDGDLSPEKIESFSPLIARNQGYLVQTLKDEVQETYTHHLGSIQLAYALKHFDLVPLEKRQAFIFSVLKKAGGSNPWQFQSTQKILLTSTVDALLAHLDGLSNTQKLVPKVFLQDLIESTQNLTFLSTIFGEFARTFLETSIPSPAPFLSQSFLENLSKKIASRFPALRAAAQQEKNVLEKSHQKKQLERLIELITPFLPDFKKSPEQSVYEAFESYLTLHMNSPKT